MTWLARILDKDVPLNAYRIEASKWDTCAIGEARGDVPLVVKVNEWSGNAPVDGVLYSLGEKFYFNVVKNQRSAALKNLLLIQKRVAKMTGVRS